MSKPELAGASRCRPRRPCPINSATVARRVRALAAPTQRSMPLGRRGSPATRQLVGAQAGRSGSDNRPAAEAASQQLLEIGARVQFRHPLESGSAAVRGRVTQATAEAAHRALAEAPEASGGSGTAGCGTSPPPPMALTRTW